MSGEAVEPIEIDGEYREHWAQGPRGMVSIGVGYGLLDRHHRYAAMLRAWGPDEVIHAQAKRSRLAPGEGT